MFQNYKKDDVVSAAPVVDRLRELIISYVGLTLQSPDMFPQPNQPVGHAELAEALMKMSSFSGPLLASTSDQILLGPGDMEQFIGDLGRRFENDGLDEVLGPVAELVAWKNEALLRPQGLGGGDTGWRQAVGAIEALVSSKAVATMITKLPRWCPANLSPQVMEYGCLLGPLMRLHTMPHTWPEIAKTYFSDVSKRTQADIDSSNANLRATLVALQVNASDVVSRSLIAAIEFTFPDPQCDRALVARGTRGSPGFLLPRFERKLAARGFTCKYT